MILNILTGDAVAKIVDLQAQISEYERIMEAFLFEVLDDKEMNRDSLIFKDKQKIAGIVFEKIRELHKRAIVNDNKQTE